jgi:hypothetical protein
MLDILLIIAALIVAVLALGGIINFNQYAGRQFGHRFFAWPRLVLGGIAAACVLAGFGGAFGAAMNLAAAAAGAVTILGLAAYNIRRTNLALGLIGSTMETALYVAAGVFGIIVALPALLVAVAATFARVEPSMRQNHVHYDNHSC